ncbi:DNA topology modulation protein FlaR [Jiella sp. MQZ9-1]|uniref:DNA topology modulation protein FlaR n=1 Tax=Jiella flava TaxID=2816857 RepID=A0A939JTM6_9HYPH|nr:DNA topology modulation protein FlaR [Jiella flava]MBO0664158.1 DNA topology modulation protein FlaR [Jiella flava]MCD2472730.1 DNA topology modulation protein FlaR [Jiella flava]
MSAEIGRNVMVVGSPGSGKSTLARVIGDRFALRVIHFDQLYWLPGWRSRENGTLPDLVTAAIRDDGWVFDGNNSRTMALRAEKADTLIWLDLPRGLCFRRVLMRIARDHGRVRRDMAEGCPERFDPAFLRWVWSFSRHSRPGLQTFYEHFPGRKYRLTAPREVTTFRQSMTSPGHAPAEIRPESERGIARPIPGDSSLAFGPPA